MSKPRPLADRFWEKVQKTETCWLWTGTMPEHGYGAIYRSRQVGKGRMAAHRVAYEMFRGPIPHGLTIDHLCRNRRCVNPDHLEAVSLAVNVMRGEGACAKFARQSTCRRGHPYVVGSWRTQIDAKGRTGRRCRLCHRITNKAARERKVASR